MRVTNIGQTFFGYPRPSNNTKTCVGVVLNDAKNQAVSNFTWNLKGALIMGISWPYTGTSTHINLGELQQTALEVPKRRKS